MSAAGLAEARDRAAWRAGRPILVPADLPVPLQCSPTKESWLEHVSDRLWWASSFTGEVPADCRPLLPLRDRLLSFGGQETCLPGMEEDLERIMEWGQLWYGHDAERMPGRQSGCHENTAALWEANRGLVLACTGYALSDDGMWRQHSWAVRPTPEGGVPVETTVRRVAYYGYAMDDDAAAEFAAANY